MQQVKNLLDLYKYTWLLDDIPYKCIIEVTNRNITNKRQNIIKKIPFYQIPDIYFHCKIEKLIVLMFTHGYLKQTFLI